MCKFDIVLKVSTKIYKCNIFMYRFHSYHFCYSTSLMSFHTLQKYSLLAWGCTVDSLIQHFFWIASEEFSYDFLSFDRTLPNCNFIVLKNDKLTLWRMWWLRTRDFEGACAALRVSAITSNCNNLCPLN